jgi:hypothetical protein
LRPERFAVERYGQRTVSNPGSDEFNGLLGLWHAIGNIEFKERLGIVMVSHCRQTPSTQPQHTRA